MWLLTSLTIDFATPSQELTVTRQPQPTFQAAFKEPVVISAPATEVKVLIHLPVNPSHDTVHSLTPSCAPTADEVQNSQSDFRDETKPPQQIASASTITLQRKESGVRQDKEKLDFHLENKDLTSGLTDSTLYLPFLTSLLLVLYCNRFRQRPHPQVSK